MKKKGNNLWRVFILCIFLYGCTNVFGTSQDDPYYYSDNALIYGTMTKQTENLLYDKTRSYLKKAHPDFIPERELVYFWATAHETNWYAYVFDKRDAGLGYEVSCENGKYGDNFNPKLFSMRQELITYMNKIMPENAEYNEYVFLNPFESGTEGLVSDIKTGKDLSIRYGVVMKKIKIREQLKKDRLVVLKASEILKKHGFKLNRIQITYAELNDTSMANYLSKSDDSPYNFLKKKMDRSYLAMLYWPSTFDKKAKYEKIGLLVYDLYNSEPPVYESDKSYFAAFANDVKSENKGFYRNGDKENILKEIQ